MKERILEVIGPAKGAIYRMMREIDFGIVWDMQNKQEVFFSVVTDFKNTSFTDIQEGDSVEVLVVRTARGLFAKELVLTRANSRLNAPHSPLPPE